MDKELKEMHTVPPKSKNRLYVIFFLIAVNKKVFETQNQLLNLKVNIDLMIGQKNWVKHFKNTNFRPFFRNESKMAKNYMNITTVSPVTKHLIFSILTFFPAFLIYEISRKIQL
jgi:hypothetical protein